MWVEKTKDEIVHERRVKRVGAILLAVALWGVLLCLTAFFSPGPGWRLSGFLRTSSLLVPPTGLYLAAAGLAVVGILWLRHGRVNRHAVMICRRCNRLKAPDRETRCKCGGDFLPLDAMKWMGEGSSNKAIGSAASDKGTGSPTPTPP